MLIHIKTWFQGTCPSSYCFEADSIEAAGKKFLTIPASPPAEEYRAALQRSHPDLDFTGPIRPEWRDLARLV